MEAATALYGNQTLCSFRSGMETGRLPQRDGNRTAPTTNRPVHPAVTAGPPGWPAAGMGSSPQRPPPLIGRPIACWSCRIALISVCGWSTDTTWLSSPKASFSAWMTSWRPAISVLPLGTAWATAVRKRSPPLQISREHVGHVGPVELADARGQHNGMVAFLRQGRHDQDRSEGVRFRRDRHAGWRWWRAVRWRGGRALFTRGCRNDGSTVTPADADAAIARQTRQGIRRRQELHRWGRSDRGKNACPTG